MSRRILLDTGPYVALLSKKDQHHARCVKAAKLILSPLCTTWPVITEAAYLLGRAGGDPRDILSWVVRGRVELLRLDDSDVVAIDAILASYADQSFSVADASLMHVAEREGIKEVFTVDDIHFSLFRTKSGDSLELIPT